MKYERLVSYVASELWAIRPEKLSEIVSALAFRAAGGAYSEAEIEARIGGRTSQPVTATGRDVAVVPIRGTIAHRGGNMPMSSGGASTEQIAEMFRAAMADDRVGTVLLDVDSPGGTVTGVPELADVIYQAREQKRIVALVNGMAASAAYWLASQAHEIVSIPSGEAGSIGVFAGHTDMTEALEKEGVKVTLIKAGKYKAEFSPFAPLTDEARAFLQARVDDTYQQFLKAVARGRGVEVGAVRDGFGEGRALDAPDAKAAGLIDRIGTVEATVGRLAGARGSVHADEPAPAVVVAVEAVAAVDESDRLRRLERF